MGVRRLAVANGPNIFQMLLVHLSVRWFNRGQVRSTIDSVYVHCDGRLSINRRAGTSESAEVCYLINI